MKIAVIGSRETEMVYNRLLFGLVSYWAIYHQIRSGMCKKGPDAVVTRVCEHMAMEWERDKKRHPRPDILLYPPKPIHWLLPEFQHMAPEDSLETRKAIVNKLHPNPDALTDWSYNLHCRNLNIINGVNLDDPVDAVVYAHRNKKVSGGTKLGVDYAESLGIKTCNVVHTPLSEVTKLIERLEG